MKHIILTLTLCLLSFVGAEATRENATHINILVGETFEYSPAMMMMASFTIESGAECIQATTSGSQIILKGLKAGEAKLKLALCNKRATTLFVHVKSRSFTQGAKPGEKPGTLVEPEDIDHSGKAHWKENYKFNPPTNHYLITTAAFKHHKMIMEITDARIDNIYATHYVEYEQKTEDVYSGKWWVMDMFDYNTRLGYNGGLDFEDNTFKMYYGDGNRICPENVEDGHTHFNTFAPIFTDYIATIFTPEFMQKHRADWNVEEDTMAAGNRPDFMDNLETYGFKQSYLKPYYRGMERICDVDCWVFDFRGLNGYGLGNGCYWIDPKTGIEMQYKSEDGDGYTTIIYDLDYREWDDFGRPDLFYNR